MTGPRGQTREQIAQTALRLFAERGFGATSLQDIANEMGFTKPALYYYFRSKDDLLEALAAPALDRLECLAEVIGRHSATPAARRGLLAELLDLYLEHRGVMTVFIGDRAALAHPAIAVRSKQANTQFHEWLAGPGAAFAARTRAVAAIAAIRSCVVAFPDTPDDELRAPVLDAARAALGIRPGHVMRLLADK
ncbi:TetR family transcriptional regulator [Streptomyces sp. SID8375]|uniref:TetR/AcrR family transcriptional regulator n=1 Tax=unclassified Streptomyces TaxID=2593676 RepID=UPI00036385CD|nr:MULTISPECIES: helix-turn-helix domain-containing protein [unclassified Streptomyces]MYX09200.1 TetR family transcriptional regulator [Streptomyces sp. SID8375]